MMLTENAFRRSSYGCGTATEDGSRGLAPHRIRGAHPAFLSGQSPSAPASGSSPLVTHSTPFPRSIHRLQVIPKQSRHFREKKFIKPIRQTFYKTIKTLGKLAAPPPNQAWFTLYSSGKKVRISSHYQAAAFDFMPPIS
jgi:hypothetical protein